MGTLMRTLKLCAPIVGVSLFLGSTALAQEPEWVPPTTPPGTDPEGPEGEIADGTILQRDRRGSLRTTEALGCGNVGISIGGGVAVLLPFYGFEIGVGLNDWLDLVGRFESVIGVFHYPHIGLRAQFPEFGGWRIGAQLVANYSFFGIKTDQVNFTSTFYLSPDLAISGPVTDETDLVFGAGGEIDFFKVEVVDDDNQVDEAFAWDATIIRAGLVSAFSSDFHGYAQLRMRIPTETFTFEAQELYVIPMLEIGGTWTF